MKYSTRTYDIETIINKINRGTVKMDSDFQRGEVWGKDRKRKLIDTILRGWPIPPIQFIKTVDIDTFEILDGLQRITTIQSFMRNEFTIDGKILPEDEEIKGLSGYRFSDLEKESLSNPLYKKYYDRFLGTDISVYQIDEASSEEIAELFYRFNNPMTLTMVEKRNAFFGITRTQIKELGEYFEEKGANRDSLGFANSRGAYEDILVKVAYLYEFKKTNEKITSDKLMNLYREEYEFTKDALDRVYTAIDTVMRGINIRNESNYFGSFKYSKATIFSLLLFYTVFSDRYFNDEEVISSLKFCTNDLSKYRDTDISNMFEYRAIVGSTDAYSIKIRQSILAFVFIHKDRFEKISGANEEKISYYLSNYNYINDSFGEREY